MNLKEQLDIQQMYNKQAFAGKNDIEKRDEVINDLKRQLNNAVKKDIVINGKGK
jgi:hypothetical protein